MQNVHKIKHELCDLIFFKWTYVLKRPSKQMAPYI